MRVDTQGWRYRVRSKMRGREGVSLLHAGMAVIESAGRGVWHTAGRRTVFPFGGGWDGTHKVTPLAEAKLNPLVFWVTGFELGFASKT